MFIISVEVLPACLLWIWTTLFGEVLVVFFAICKSLVMGPYVVLFNVVVGYVVLYVLCIVLSVVFWDFLCLYSGFLPCFDVPFSVVVALVAGRSLALF